jgi:hypothetical protein
MLVFGAERRLYVQGVRLRSRHRNAATEAGGAAAVSHVIDPAKIHAAMQRGPQDGKPYSQARAAIAAVCAEIQGIHQQRPTGSAVFRVEVTEDEHTMVDLMAKAAEELLQRSRG